MRRRWLQQSLQLQQDRVSRDGAGLYSYEAAVAHLVKRGLPEHHVRAGSMPESSLRRCAEVIAQSFDRAEPLTILHVGNFVGVSLSWFADYTRGWNGQSRVVGVDPNVTHRGIERPQDHVVSLLTNFGFETTVMLVTGYTLHKNAGDLDRGDPRGSFAGDQSCECALPLLADLAMGSFDVAVMDGNHESDYLRAELVAIRRLLRSGGLLVLDDVFDWDTLAPIPHELEASPDATLLARDSRLGIWQLG